MGISLPSIDLQLIFIECNPISAIAPDSPAIHNSGPAKNPSQKMFQRASTAPVSKWGVPVLHIECIQNFDGLVFSQSLKIVLALIECGEMWITFCRSKMITK